MGSPGLQLGRSPEGSAHGRSYVSLAECSVFVAVEYLHSHASKLRSFIYRLQTGNYRRKLTTSSGAFCLAISGRRLPLFRRLVNSRKLKATIRTSASVGAI